MIKDFVCHVRRHAQPGHPGHAGSAQIMEAPPAHPRQLIEATLGISEVLEGLIPSSVKTSGPRWSARFSTANACLDRWTMCALAFFVRALGIVQIRGARSSSSQ